MSTLMNISEGELSLGALYLKWPDINFCRGEVIVFEGSPNAPISDFFYLAAGLQTVRRTTAPAKGNNLLREDIETSPQVLSKFSFRGRSVYEIDNGERAKLIGFVFNDPELCTVGPTVTEDIRQAFASVGQELPPPQVFYKYGFLENKLGRKCETLSGGELHRLGCLVAAERNPKILFVDLSRSNLDVNFVEWFSSRLQEFVHCGCTVIITGFYPHSSVHVAKRYVISDDGVVSPAAYAESHQGLTTQPLTRIFKDDVVVNAKDICRLGVTKPFSFSLRKGEVCVVYGENGSGKTSIGLILTGRCKRCEYGGSFEISKSAKPVMALQHSARSFIAPSLLAEYEDIGFWHTFGFSTDECNIHPRNLCYGSMKLASSALALVRSGDFCILDEPTCGMDDHLRLRFKELLNYFPSKTVLILSHDAYIERIATTKLDMPEVL